MPNLPTPSPIALKYSGQLSEIIRREIEDAGGYISFARYMDMALFTPGLGYYSAGAYKLGKEGDFLTAPEISPLFAQSIAQQCQQILKELGKGDILELGAGSGKFARDLLIELDHLNALPQHYYILEISADLRERQRNLIRKECPQFLSRVHWLDTFPHKPIVGIIFANEVLDAMPIHCFQIAENSILERCVEIQDEKFSWVLTEPTSSELIRRVNAIQQTYFLEIGYQSEINLTLEIWIQALADSLERGVMLFLDYGYGRKEYYHPDRELGTLMCYYQHTRFDNPFILPGLEDITAHVDFTTLAEGASDAGLRVVGYTTQSSFLFACGLMDLASRTELNTEDLYRQNQAIKLLTLPSQMGESVKVMGLTKDFDHPLKGFSLYDRRKDL